MKKIVFLLEEPSMKELLDNLLPRLLTSLEIDTTRPCDTQWNNPITQNFGHSQFEEHLFRFLHFDETIYNIHNLFNNISRGLFLKRCISC